MVIVSGARLVGRCSVRACCDTTAAAIRRLKVALLSSARMSPVLRRLTAAYPHLFAHLEGENVESVKEVHRRESEKGWDEALADKEIQEWLV